VGGEKAPIRPEGESRKGSITPQMLSDFLDTTPLDEATFVENTDEELTLLADDLNKEGVEPKDLLHMSHADFLFWQTAIKKRRVEVGPDGTSHVVNDVEQVGNRGRRLRLRPQKDGVLPVSDWIVTPPPLKVYSTKTKPGKVRAEKVALVVADHQIDFREHRDGTLTPTHDPRAMDITAQINKDLQPDLIFSGGDEQDFSRLGKYKPDSVHFMSPQNLRRGVLAGHAYFAQLRRDNPNAAIKMISSNHHQRWVDFFLKNAAELVEVRPADDPDGLPLFSLERAMGLKALDIDYIAGYDAAVFRFNERLVGIHGNKSVNNGSTAHEYLREFVDESVLFNHTHRIERAMKSHKGRVIQAISSGCLASVMGSVPSFHNDVDTGGEIVPQQENWQNGFSIVHYTEGNGAFQVEQVLIDHNNGYKAVYNGKEYYPRSQEERTWEQFEEGLRIREFPAELPRRAV
jgi:hypothetical protein